MLSVNDWLFVFCPFWTNSVFLSWSLAGLGVPLVLWLRSYERCDIMSPSCWWLSRRPRFYFLSCFSGVSVRQMFVWQDALLHCYRCISFSFTQWKTGCPYCSLHECLKTLSKTKWASVNVSTDRFFNDASTTPSACHCWVVHLGKSFCSGIRQLDMNWDLTKNILTMSILAEIRFPPIAAVLF